jgi:uncharacterized membrane protein
MGIPFPIAFLTALPFADAAFGWTADPFWARVAWWLAALGLCTGGGAALGGLVDFVTIRRARAHAAGWIHAGGNAIAMALTFVNLWLRWDDPAAAVFPAGILLSIVVAILLVITGWYGGELAYRYLIGVTGE